MLYPNPVLIHEVAITTGTPASQSDAQRLAQLSQERMTPMPPPTTEALAGSLMGQAASLADMLRIEKGLRYAAHYASMLLF
jgi:hypothetical protein